ncbi:MAG: hypothetical protein DDT19_02706 [Syntrophomonadaceae bacterium]|nr:hypothetical protein [Bacillota bacterium]
MVYRTLKQLRDEVSLRLGFGAQYSHVNAAILNSFLRSANEQIWIQSSWLHGRRVTETTTNQRFLTYPTGAAPGFLTSVSVRVSGQWAPLIEGIDDAQRGAVVTASWPSRYAENAHDAGTAKIELWPAPSQNVNIRIQFDASPGVFVNDTDRPSVPDELVFLHALVNGKLHYRQPDGQGYSSQLETMLDAYRTKNFGRKVFKPDERAPDPYSFPPG